MDSFLLLCIMAGISLAIGYLLTLQKTLKAIQPKNRKMEPGEVWLSLIPLFGLVWNFILVRKVSDSIYAELTSRSLPVSKEPTYNLGLAFSIFTCALVLSQWLGPLGTFLAVIDLVLWITYWAKIYDFKKQLEAIPSFEEDNNDDSVILK